MIFDVVFVI